MTAIGNSLLTSNSSCTLQDSKTEILLENFSFSFNISFNLSTTFYSTFLTYFYFFH